MNRSLISLIAILSLPIASAFAVGSNRRTSQQPQVKSFRPSHVAVVQRRPVAAAKSAKSGAARNAVRRSFTGFSSPLTSFQFLAGAPLTAGALGFYTGVVGDYSGDGKKDVATVVSSDYGSTFSLAVMLGNGDGTFSSAQNTSISFSSLDRVYAADLNHDLKDDIVIVRKGSFDVFISNGDGTFASAVNYPDSLGAPAAVALADLDGDTHIDVIITDGISSPDTPLSVPTVATFLNNGSGVFALATQTVLPGQLSAGVFADATHDGTIDLVGATQVFPGVSLGTFLSPVSLTASNGQPNSCAAQDGTVAVADLNGDFFPDIVTADCQNASATVYLNLGNGTWAPGVSYFAGAYPQGIEVGDVNGDNKIDLVVNNADSSNVTLLLNQGLGVFQAPESGYAVGGFGWHKPMVADFDGDNVVDVLVANYVPELQFSLMFLHSFGDGTLAGAANYFAKPSAGSFAYGTGIAAADFNNDGRADFVRGNANNSGAGVTVFLTNNDSTMQAGVNYGSGNYNFVRTGDFNGDTKQDVVAVDDTGAMNLFLGNGDGTFQAPQSFPALLTAAEGLVVGDFDHDGKTDLAVTGSGNVAVLLNNGAGGFNLPVTYPISAGGAAMADGDINGDGNLDLVVPLAYSNMASILTGNSNGTFQSVADIDLGFSFPQALAIGDFNGDGKADLAVTIDDNSAAMGVDVLLGNGNGTFQAGNLYSSTNLSSPIGLAFPGGVQAIDLDGDGKLDLVYDNSEYETVGVMFGQGDGTFLSPNETPVGGYPVELVVADVDGDGSQDVVTSMASFPGITVLLNTSGSSIAVVSDINPIDPGQVFVLTATVAGSGHHSRKIPTGTVTFTEGATVLGTASLSGGTALLALSESTSGDHTITATYSGDSSFLGKSVDFVETINVGGFSADYSLSASPMSAVLQAGQSATFNITVTPSNGFNSPINFSCGMLPAGVSCLFTPASVTPSNGPVQVQLVISSSSLRASGVQSRRGLPLLASVTIGFFGFVLLEGFNKKHKRAAILSMALLTVLILMGTVGCGSSMSSPRVNNAQAVQVVASGPGTTHQLNIMLTIEQ